MGEVRCAVSLEFGNLTRKGLLEEHMDPGIGRGKVGGLREQKERCRRIESRKQRDHRPTCDTRAAHLTLQPHHGRFKKF